jgi:hypothetical protein
MDQNKAAQETHLSSLVLRDRLRMHMQAAALIGRLWCDSAATTCTIA